MPVPADAEEDISTIKNANVAAIFKNASGGRRVRFNTGMALFHNIFGVILPVTGRAKLELDVNRLRSRARWNGNKQFHSELLIVLLEQQIGIPIAIPIFNKLIAAVCKTPIPSGIDRQRFPRFFGNDFRPAWHRTHSSHIARCGSLNAF